MCLRARRTVVHISPGGSEIIVIRTIIIIFFFLLTENEASVQCQLLYFCADTIFNYNYFINLLLFYIFIFASIIILLFVVLLFIYY